MTPFGSQYVRFHSDSADSDSDDSPALDPFSYVPLSQSQKPEGRGRGNKRKGCSGKRKKDEDPREERKTPKRIRKPPPLPTATADDKEKEKDEEQVSQSILRRDGGEIPPPPAPVLEEPAVPSVSPRRPPTPTSSFSSSEAPSSADPVSAQLVDAIKSPVKLSAVRTDGMLQVNVKVDSDMDLRHLQLKIPTSELTDQQAVPSPIGNAGGAAAAVVEYQTLATAKEPPPGAADQKKLFSIFEKAKLKSPAKKEDLAEKYSAYRIRPGSRVIRPPLEKGQGQGQPYNKRQCPFYKRIPDTPFCVDAFSYGAVPGATKYFLSHFHYDHYGGLGKRFSAGLIICSEITARLVRMKLGVEERYLRPLPLNDAVVMDGVEVTLLDANHCPGSVMFLFKFMSGRASLHCGDFRAVPEMEENPALWNVDVKSVYLDTTYCKPEHDFPSQTDVIERTRELVREHLKTRPSTLVAVGSYTIGKERIFKAIAEETGSKVWANSEKARVLRALRDGDIDGRLVPARADARVHVVDMKTVRSPADLDKYLGTVAGFNHALAVIPTGWTHSSGGKRGGGGDGVAALRVRKISERVSRLEVPYSEHSSFSELRRFVRFLSLRSADCVIPTVNVGSPAAREEMKGYFRQWVENKNTPTKDIGTYFKRTKN